MLARTVCLGFQSSFSEAFHCNLPRRCGSGPHLWAFNPHFQRHFTATRGPYTTSRWTDEADLSILIFRGISLQQRKALVNKVFERIFQSSFSEAFHCNKGGYLSPYSHGKPFNPHFQRHFTATYWLKKQGKYHLLPFNPHFQRHFTATPIPASSRRPPSSLSILIFRGISLQPKPYVRPSSKPKNFQSSFSEAFHCNG